MFTDTEFAMAMQKKALFFINEGNYHLALKLYRYLATLALDNNTYFYFKHKSNVLEHVICTQQC